jgi:hypothetical protein
VINAAKEGHGDGEVEDEFGSLPESAEDQEELQVGQFDCSQRRIYIAVKESQVQIIISYANGMSDVYFGKHLSQPSLMVIFCHS